jgi:hypothetical protein
MPAVGSLSIICCVTAHSRNGRIVIRQRDAHGRHVVEQRERLVPDNVGDARASSSTPSMPVACSPLEVG